MSIIYKIYSWSKLFIYSNILNKFFGDKLLYKFFCKKIYSEELLYSKLKTKEHAKYFVINNFENFLNLEEVINNYPKVKNNFQNKNIRTYQSEHNIHKFEEFKDFSNFLEKFLNEAILPHYSFSNYKLKINKMWFVISKSMGKIHPHNHLDGHISGVFYPKRSSEINGLTIYNPFKNLQKFVFQNFNFEEKNFLTQKKTFERSEKNKMIIFDSFLMHSVDHIKFNENTETRVSLAWDAKFEKL